MREKTIKVYGIKELNDKAKEKALDKYREINVDFDWWDFLMDDLSTDIKEKIGLDISSKNICFDFGRGCNIYIDSNVVIKALSVKYPTIINMDLPKKFGCFTNYLGGGLNSGLKGSEFNTDYIDFEELEDDSQLKQVVFSKTLDKLRDKIGSDLYELQNLLESTFKALWEEYHYRLSDESIIETLECNEFEFLEDGRVA